MADPMVGKTVAGCRILKKLGEGGMGVAYSAHHTRLDRVVVIKFLYPKIAAKPGAVESFKKEAQAAARLEHPRITQVYDVGTENDIHYIVMQFIDGETLEDLMERTGKMDALKSLAILKASLEGLQEAHSHGIVHRDIKPSNILLGKDGSIRLADFGLALKTDPSGKAQGAEIIGTPLYMSPEQIWGQAVDGRCDIYAMGATYFHMLTGVPPYSGPTSQDIVAMHVNSPVPDPREIHPGISKMCGELIMRMMAKKPAERYKDVPDLLQALNSPGIVVADASDIMGDQMIDLGIPAQVKKTAELPAASTNVPPPVPAPGGATPTVTPAPDREPELDPLAEPFVEPEPEPVLNPAGWKPLSSVIFWLLTGGSAVFAGLQKNTLFLGGTGILTLVSSGVAPAGLGLVTISSLGLAMAALYGAGLSGTPPTPESLAGAQRLLGLPVAIFGLLAVFRLAGQKRKSRFTVFGIALVCVLTAAGAFTFALPDSMTWQVLLDGKARHPKALTLLAAGACFLVLVVNRNRNIRLEASAPAMTFSFALLGAATFFFAGVVHHAPPEDKEAAKKSKSEAVVMEIGAAAEGMKRVVDTIQPSVPRVKDKTEETGPEEPEADDMEGVIIEVGAATADMKRILTTAGSEEQAKLDKEVADRKKKRKEEREEEKKRLEKLRKKEAMKPALQKLIEKPFKGFPAKLLKSGTLAPIGLLFLLFGAFVFWEDARIFEQDKTL